MSKVLKVSASDFARQFGRYQDEALAGAVISVTSRGRIVGGYISAKELKHFEDLKRKEREVFVTGEIPDDIMDAIDAAQYGVPAQ